MKITEQLSILGCGWLGMPLAKQFMASGYRVKGSIRKKEDFEKLTRFGIEPYIIDIGSNQIKGEVNGFMKDSAILIISIPPGLRKRPKESFIDKMKNLLLFIERSSIKKVLFISSISVYGNDNSVITEKTLPVPETEPGRQLLAAEQLLRNNSCFETTILRFGGLIGPDRHPIKYLAGKKNLKNPKAPINLIYLDDCINIISRIVTKEHWGEIFNAVAPFHPTREEYYTEQAKLKGLKAPMFNQSAPSHGKTISSHKIQEALNIDLQKEVY